MRIAYIINSVEGGGAASPVPAVTDVLRRAGADIKIFALTRRDGRALPLFEAAGLDVIVRPGGDKDHVAAWRWLDAEIRAWGATHLWTSLTRATLLGQLVGLRRHLPVTSWQHAAFLKPANRRLLRIGQRLSRLWIGDSEAVTRLTAERLGVGPDRLIQWPIFRADAEAPQATRWQAGEAVRIGSLGRLHPVKGYHVLIEAMRRIDPAIRCELHIHGEGAQRDALETQVRDAGLHNVYFPGYVQNPQAFLTSLHLYVQPSLSEGLCIAAHEAMQSALPVIASAVGELPHSIQDGVSGWTVPPGDPDALAGALQKLLEQPETLAGMGASAREQVLDRFGPDRFEATGRAIIDRMKAF